MRHGNLEFSEEKVLVTGGAGFVGSNVVRKLLELNSTVIVLDDFFTGCRENLPKHPNLKVIEGSVSDVKLVRKLVKSVTIVIQFTR